VYVVDRNNDTDPAVGSPVKDPADVIAGPVDRRAPALDATPAAHIVPAAGQADALRGSLQLSSGIAAAPTTSAAFAEENPYIGPTLDRLSETALVLNDGITDPAASPAPPGLAGAPTARCTIKVTSNKVLLAAPRGKPKKGAPAPRPGTSR